MCEPVAAVAGAPLIPRIIILLGVGSNPGREQKNEHIFFSVQTFSHILIWIEFVINKGVFTNNMDQKGGGEAFFTSRRNDLVHSVL